MQAAVTRSAATPPSVLLARSGSLVGSSSGAAPACGRSPPRLPTASPASSARAAARAVLGARVVTVLAVLWRLRGRHCGCCALRPLGPPTFSRRRTVVTGIILVARGTQTYRHDLAPWPPLLLPSTLVSPPSRHRSYSYRHSLITSRNSLYSSVYPREFTVRPCPGVEYCIAWPVRAAR